MLLDSFLNRTSSRSNSNIDLEISLFAKAIDPLGYRDNALDGAGRVGSWFEAEIPLSQVDRSRVHGGRESMTFDREWVIGRRVPFDEVCQLSKGGSRLAQRSSDNVSTTDTGASVY